MTRFCRSIAIAACVLGLILTARIARSMDAQVSIELFPLQVHPLPALLAQWEDTQGNGDYFDRVQPKDIGYLVWSEFPVQIYIQPPETETSEEGRRQEAEGRRSQYSVGFSQGRRSANRPTPIAGHPISDLDWGLNPCSLPFGNVFSARRYANDEWSQQKAEDSIPSASCPLPSAFLANPKNPDRSWEILAEPVVREWGEYLPLAVVRDPQLAQITLIRGSPPPERSAAGVVRARSALTRYHLDLQHSADGQSRLAQRFTITISPTQTENYQRAALRHELGHALGIWGHSNAASDALYASQVREPPGISKRDINTLKRVYEQPTRLGWWVFVNE